MFKNDISCFTLVVGYNRKFQSLNTLMRYLADMTVISEVKISVS